MLSPKQSKALFAWGGRLESKEYVDLEARVYDDKGRHAPAKSLMGKARDVPKVLARDEAGNVRELVRAEDYRAAVKAAGNGDRLRGASTSPVSATVRADREREKAKRAAFEATLEKLRNAAKTGRPDGLWHALARASVRVVWADIVNEACKRRGIVAGKNGSKSDALLAAVADMTTSDACGLVVELAVTGSRHDREETLKELLELFGVEKTKPAAPKGSRTKAKKGAKK